MVFDTTHRKNFVFLGPPGSGKGTQAVTLAKEFNLCHLSTGDILRAEVKSGSEMGKLADAKMKAGELVDDYIVEAILDKNLFSSATKNGFILDGYPRTLAHAQTLEKILTAKNDKISGVVQFDIADDVVVQRISGRLLHEPSGRTYNLFFKPPKVAGKDDITGEALIQRKDDQESVVRKRLGVYHKSSNDLIHFYEKKGLLIRINAEQSIEQVLDAMKSIFAAKCC